MLVFKQFGMNKRSGVHVYDFVCFVTSISSFARMYSSCNQGGLGRREMDLNRRLHTAM